MSAADHIRDWIQRLEALRAQFEAPHERCTPKPLPLTWTVNCMRN